MSPFLSSPAAITRESNPPVAALFRVAIIYFHQSEPVDKNGVITELVDALSELERETAKSRAI